jgi:S-DNA-T family DNA segregation ATPase FtsK/SpoIIIE
MANKLKSESEEVVKEKKERSKKSTNSVSLRERFASLRSFFKDERTHKIFGLFLLMMAFFMIVAFISNLFTWKEDQVISDVDSIWKLIITETNQACLSKMKGCDY